jgi:putative membrane protein
MWVVAKGLAGLVMLLHVYIVLIETVLFRVRGKKVFGMTDERAEIMAPAMSNQGCYNGFLVAALALGFVLPNPAVASALTVYGLGCVVVAGIWGAVTVKRSILYFQTIPAAAALVAHYLAQGR